MKKSYSFYKITLLIVFFFLVSCHKNKEAEVKSVPKENLLGNWYINVQQNELSGKEELVLDSINFFITDSLQYSGNDSGFDFKMDLVVHISGEWDYKNDSLLFYYNKEKLQVIPINESFEISMSQAGGNENNLLEVKDKMAEDLFTNIKYSIINQFESLDVNTPIYKGSPLRIINDTLQVSYNNIIINYVR